MQYCIVTVLATSGIVSTVYGPFDRQGCEAAYREHIAEWEREGKRVAVRGIFPIAEFAETEAVEAGRER